MTMWMVRAEVGSRLFRPFMDKGLVAVGWPEVGDLTSFGSRDAILERIQEIWPDWKRQGQINAAGMLYRFSKQLQKGDRVITCLTSAPLGQIEGFAQRRISGSS